VLFSDPAVQDFVRANFVAAWQSVRPVPIVTIDFGNGHTLRRTLNGNVATYVCDPEGRVIDVIPGLCEPATYVRELGVALALYERSRADFGVVAAWHVEQAAGARKASLDERDERGTAAPRLDVSKSVVEDPLKAAIRRDQELLATDGRRNLRWRKPIVHQLLSRPGVRPADIEKQLYFSALHVDLEDPYLGLEGGAFSGGAYGGFDLDVLLRGGDPRR
jgi:hypothetical protein